jgi:hypothetical protein
LDGLLQISPPLSWTQTLVLCARLPYLILYHLFTVCDQPQSSIPISHLYGLEKWKNHPSCPACFGNVIMFFTCHHIIDAHLVWEGTDSDICVICSVEKYIRLDLMEKIRAHRQLVINLQESCHDLYLSS